jgi:glyoxylate carboligase
VTTATTAVVAQFSLVAIVLLLGLLVSKEMVSASDRPLLKSFGRVLNVAVVPLLRAFAVIAAVRVFDVLYW